MMMLCCNEEHDTNFCPHCGNELSSYQLSGLLQYCVSETNQRQKELDRYKKDLEEIRSWTETHSKQSNRIKHKEIQVKIAQDRFNMWNTWTDSLRGWIDDQD